MKSLYLLILFVFATRMAFAQCTTAVTNNIYTQQYTNIASQGSDQLKLDKAIDFGTSFCVSSAQVKAVAMLFATDEMRYDFCMISYHNVVDKHDFYIVYDAFQTFSHAIKLHDYVLDHKAIEKQEQTPVDTVSVLDVEVEPEVLCAVDEDRFKDMLIKIKNANFDDDRVAIVKLLNEKNCFSTAQVKRIIEEFNFPAKKLDVAEILYPKCTDRENYYQLQGSFSFPSYESDFEEMLKD